MKQLNELYNELYAISLIYVEDIGKREYLIKLMIDYRNKLDSPISENKEDYYRDHFTESYEQIKDEVLLDNTLPIEEKLNLLKNFTEGEIKSKSQIRRLNVQKG